MSYAKQNLKKQVAITLEKSILVPKNKSAACWPSAWALALRRNSPQQRKGTDPSAAPVLSEEHTHIESELVMAPAAGTQACKHDEETTTVIRAARAKLPLGWTVAHHDVFPARH